MSAAVNGLALSKLRAFGSGFLIFSDYGRAPIRLSAIMEIPTIHIFTHDSIGVGEDGPTHQPIEHLASLRAMPALITIRPGDANEVAEAWRLTMELKHDPVVLVLSRRADADARPLGLRARRGVRRGAYVLADPPEGDPEVIIMATGTEVALGVAAYEQLTEEGVRARVVSMPSGSCSSARTRTTARRCCRCRSPRASASSRLRLRLGPLRRPDRARRSPCASSARPPR